MSQSLSSDVIKIGFVISIAFSFPLVIFPCRASLYSLLYRQGHMEANQFIPETRFRAMTGAIVFCSLLVGLVIPSVELVIGLVGSTIGIAICIVFPACCFAKVSQKESTEKLLAKLMIVAGFCLMVLGTYANLSAIDDKVVVSHDVHVPESEHLLPVINNLNENVLNGLGEGGNEGLSKLEYKVENGGEKPKLKTDDDNKEEKLKLDDIIGKDTEIKPKIVEEKKIEKEEENEKENLKIENVELKNPLNNDAIKKEDEEELTANKDAKVVVQEELNAVVDEIKRQNEETQKKVLEKLEEIVEKIEHKLDPGATVEKKAGAGDASAIDKEVLNQVRDMFPDPIPLRAVNNNIVLADTDGLSKGAEDKVYAEANPNKGIVLESNNNINSNSIPNETKVEEDKEKAAIVKEELKQKLNKALEEELERERNIKKDDVAIVKNEETLIEKKEAVQSDVIDNKEVKVKETEKEEKKVDKVENHDDDIEAIRRDLLNVDNDESLARFKRKAEDCEKEI